MLAGSPGTVPIILIGWTVAVVVHFISYLVVGLPFYHFFWQEDSCLWNGGWGLLAGAIAGGMTFLVIGLVFSGGATSGMLFFAVIGAIYGSLSALGGLSTHRRLLRRKKQADEFVD